jgi:hypothetical protein
MAKEPIFRYKSINFSAALVKVDRDKVYGWTETKYKDDDGNMCTFMSLLDDGKTLIGTGAIALRTVDVHGNEIDKSTLVARHEDGSLAEIHPSIFDLETVLDDSKTIHDYMDMDVKAVYQLKTSESLTGIFDVLKVKKVLYFTFNYRASYDTDDAFLISQGDHIFAVVGKLTTFQYSSLALPTMLEDDADDSAEDLDFNMF